jgi:dUTP pyrophosphatase
MHTLEVAMSVVMCNRNSDVVVPQYESYGAAGMDIQADIEESFVLGHGERRLVNCGFKLEVPKGFEVQVRPRSGLAHKYGLSIVNSPGTIDSDYRGEIMCNLINLGQEAITITPAMRIAQIVLSPVTRGVLIETQSLSSTERGENGHGSTGTH